MGTRSFDVITNKSTWCSRCRKSIWRDQLAFITYNGNKLIEILCYACDNEKMDKKESGTTMGRKETTK